ncbi:MAG: hypothetical protein KDE33_21135 [Bacteroidetes bacterium]|nr:hypothetical protein [Bacteroidota bacterium]
MDINNRTITGKSVNKDLTLSNIPPINAITRNTSITIKINLINLPESMGSSLIV